MTKSHPGFVERFENTANLAANEGAPAGYAIKPGPRRPTVTLMSGVQTLRLRASHVGFRTLALVPQDAGLEDFPDSYLLARIDGTNLEPLDGRIVRRVYDADGCIERVDFELTAVTRPIARKLTLLASQLDLQGPPMQSASTVAQTEVISEPARAATILRALVSNNSEAILRAEGNDWVLRARAVHDDRIEWKIEAEGGAPTSPMMVEAIGYSGVYRLPVLIIEQRGKQLVTTRPKRLSRTRQRRMPRGQPTKAYRVVFKHPLWNDLVGADVVDLAHGGLGIVFDPLEDLLHPGMDLPDVELRLGEQVVTTFNAVVRTASPKLEEAASCGIAIEPKTPLDARVWRRIVSEELHDTSDDFPTDPQQVWDLFCESGYLNLSGKCPEEFERLRGAFIRSSRKLRTAPEMSCQVVWPSSTGIAASVTQLKIYSGSWLDFHLAKLPGKFVDGVPGRRVLRDIHLHSIEHLLADPKMRWFMGYIQDDGSRFSKLAMLDFLERVSDDQNACGIPFVAMDLGTEGAPELAAARGVRVATAEERALVLAKIQECRPTAYCQAHDYVAGEFDLHSVRAAWTATDLLRDREVLVATENDQAVAAAICEVAEDGLHLFGLLDCVRTFSLRDGGEARFNDLLRGAQAWFASFGKTRFIFLDEWDTALDAELNARNLGRAVCAILSDSLIPDYLDHFFEWMAWAPTGQSQIPPALVPVEESAIISLQQSA